MMSACFSTMPDWKISGHRCVYEKPSQFKVINYDDPTLCQRFMPTSQYKPSKLRSMF